LVTPGYYRERIKMKPWVNLVGVSKESVYLQPLAPWDVPQPRWERQTPREHVLSPDMADAIIELSNNCNITNLSILNPAWATSENVAIRGRAVKGIGLTDLDVFPGSDWPDSPPVRAGGPFSRGRILELTGDSGICIVTALGFTYLGPDSFAVKLEGIGQNADCHFINCFFDALFVETTTSGCVQIRDCYDVHIRNSLLRVNNAHLGSVQEAPEVLGCAVDVAGAAQLDAPGHIPTNVVIEGSSLQCPRKSSRALNIGPHANCFFKHSSTDSIMVWGGNAQDPVRFYSTDIPAVNRSP